MSFPYYAKMIATPLLSVKTEDKSCVSNCGYPDNISKYIWCFLMVYAYILKTKRICDSHFSRHIWRSHLF